MARLTLMIHRKREIAVWTSASLLATAPMNPQPRHRKHAENIFGSVRQVLDAVVN
jgi:hypothetical protein